MAALKLGLAVIISVFLGEVHTSESLDFDPQLKGYVPQGGWQTVSAEIPLKASVQDFKNGVDCKRLIAFHARGSVMQYITRDCNTPITVMGLVNVGSSIYFYNEAMAHQRSGNTFIVIVAQPDQSSCSRTMYTLTDVLSNEKLESTMEVSDTETLPATDKDCQNLMQGNKINMMLLSEEEGVKGFKKRGEVNEYNYWKHMGVTMQLYYNGKDCYRLLNFVSFGKLITRFKVSCGPVQGMIMRDDALIYGNAIMVKPGTDEDRFTFFLNYRDGTCVKKKIAFKGRRKVFTEVISREIIYKPSEDGECEHFLQREMVLNGGIVGIKEIDNHYSSLTDEATSVPSDDKALKAYKATSKWSIFNLQMPLGVMVRTYKDKEDCITFIMFTIEEVPLDFVTMPCGEAQTPQELVTNTKEGTVNRGVAQVLVTQEHALYYNKVAMVKRDPGSNQVTMLVNNKDATCTRKVYALVERDERLRCDKKSSVAAIQKDSDPECKDLIEGITIEKH